MLLEIRALGVVLLRTLLYLLGVKFLHPLIHEMHLDGVKARMRGGDLVRTGFFTAKYMYVYMFVYYLNSSVGPVKDKTASFTLFCRFSMETVRFVQV